MHDASFLTRAAIGLLLVGGAACSSDPASGSSSASTTGGDGGQAHAGGSGGAAGAPSAGGGGAGGGAPKSTSAAAAAMSATHDVQCVGGQGGQDIRPFYWEIGDVHGALASGSVDADDGKTTYKADTVMAIASASKWLYSTYYVQKIGGGSNLSAEDIQFFNFWSGYSNFSSCMGAATVGSCLDIGKNGVKDPSTVDFFAYGGGHMQNHAASIAKLGNLDNAGLAAEIKSQIGSDVGLSYSEPQPAGGGDTSAAEYAKVLRKILSGEMKMKDVLGTHEVCVDPTTCPKAKSSPSPPGVEWHYSIGHWVEDDPTTGDGSFSSAGAFGFYPWIDHDKLYYGVLARRGNTGGAGFDSANCGHQIRQAWLNGTAD